MIGSTEELITGVAVTLVGGHHLNGAVYGFPMDEMMELLGQPAEFVQLVLEDGGLAYVSKKQIAVLRSSSRRSGLRAPAPAASLHELLDLPLDATPDVVRLTYLDRAARYNPAQYGGLTLPDEVRDYLEAMHDALRDAYQAYITPRPTS